MLAWTQRDLADRAQTAVSTIADFERGARSPIANSIEALEVALKDGGVSFEGGRAVLADGSGGFTHLDGGRPIPLLTSADLIDWANRLDSQAGLPMLISMLVRASAGADAILRFPADEGVRDPGWDGICDSPRSADYVPKGPSRWELSVEKNPQMKAERDFKKRAAEGDAETRSATTYVAVTMRAWTNKDMWAAQHRKAAIFKEVRAVDVHDLVQWLAMHVQVADWLAVRLGKRSISGVASLEEGWRRWALATTPPLTERVVLAGRDREASDVLAWLKDPPSVLHVQAAEREEAIAFLFAAIGQLPKEYRETYRTHALVAESDSAVRDISVAMKPQIIVMSGADQGFAASTAQAGHHVYAVHGPETQLENGVSLGNVRRVDLADALEESMGQKPDDARALAGRAGGSIGTLRRILSEAATMPAWMTTVSRNTVNAAFFAGAWDESAPADQEIIAALAQRPFDDVSGELASLTAGIGAPLRRSISKVQVVSIQDLWSVIAPRLNDADVVAYLDTTRDVFSNVDPRFHEPDRARLITFGDRPHIATKELRRGLLETLNAIAAFPMRAKNVPFLEERIRGFVRELLDDADAARWWSLREVLPLLAEAAPEEFLAAVEASVTRDDAPITVLLKPEGEGFFARDYVSELTTALERLAWFPEYFDDAVTTLAGLADKDPKDSRHGNRPAGTLRQIFLLWHPQTLAPSDARLATLDRLRTRYPGVAWRLLVSLLPKMGDTSSFSSKPAWRRLPAEGASTIAQTERAKDVSTIFDWLLEDAGHDVSRWNGLLENLTGLNEAQQCRATEGVLQVVHTLEGDDDRLAARDIVRTVLHRHREFAHTAWAMPESVLGPLQEAFEFLTPGNIVDRERWVFANQPAPPDPVPGHDLQIMEAHNVANRHRVARELIVSANVEEIFAMAIAVENPIQLGIAIVGVDVNETLRDTLIERGAHSPEPHLREFARGIVYAGIMKYGAVWAASAVRDGAAAGWSTAALVSILQGMPQDSDTFDLVREAGGDVERIYWQTTPWMCFIHSVPHAIVLAVEAKLRVGRSIEAAALIGQTGPAAFPSGLLLRSLTEASVQLRAERGQADSMLSHYCGLILDRLIADQSVARDELVRLEWAYFGLFQASGRDSALLEAGLARHPEFFVDVVSSVYRGDGDDDTAGEEDDAMQRMAVAEQSYTLLDKWSTVPGCDVDGTIDADALSEWVQKARELAIPARRVDIIDQQIGAILSAAQPEPNGDWPPKAVREILERVRSKQLEAGFQVGTHNRRGTTTRGPLDGGELERDLKSHYEALAKRFRSSSPRTATVLKAIAAGYKIDALYMDQLADAVDRA
ncbi:MAG TPA: helix-turn-helix transcriptional regulator [Candidatus Elarobacter sp.]